MTAQSDLQIDYGLRPAPASTELDAAAWAVSTSITPATHNSQANSLQIQGSSISPICSGVDPVLIEYNVIIQTTGTVGASAKGLMSIMDITAGLPSGSGAFSIFDLQTPTVALAAIWQFSGIAVIGTPPAGMRQYACFLFNNNSIVGVTNVALSTNRNFIRAIVE